MDISKFSESSLYDRAKVVDKFIILVTSVSSFSKSLLTKSIHRWMVLKCVGYKLLLG